MTDFILDDFLPYQISVLAKRMSQDLEVHYRRKFGLRVPEWRIMAHLSQSEPVSVRELVVRVDMHKSRVSRAARQLEVKGLLSSSTNLTDRRLIDLHLTGRGREVMAELIPIANSFQTELLNRLGSHCDGFRRGTKLLLGET
ncbi:MAG: MarR family transcriptional regulator [Rhodobacteraceae bacterium]|nr:MarR family transcriptional regulator [Paracoccaceae bacterium]